MKTKLALCLLCCSLAACKPQQAGKFSVGFSWAAGAHDFGTQAVWMLARVEDRSGPTPVLLTEAGPDPYTSGAKLSFDSVPNGSNRVVVVQLQDAPGSAAQVLYYGISNPFTLTSGQDIVVDVALQLQAAPGTAPGTAGIAVARGITNSNLVTLLLSTDAGVKVRLANTPALPDPKDAEALGTAVTTASGIFTYSRAAWDLDKGLTPCASGTVCPRTVYASFVDANGVSSPTVSVDVTVDRLLPDLVSPRANPLNSRLGTVVVFALQPTKTLARAPVPHVYAANGAELFDFLHSTPDSQYTFTHTVTPADANGSYRVAFDLTDLADNARTVALPDPFAIDSVQPILSRLLLSAGRVKAGAVLGIGFTLNKAVNASQVLVTIGGSTGKAICTQGSTAIDWNCTYSVTGNELPPGSIQAQVVLATVTDAAGNTGSASSSVVFDFLAPGLVSPIANPAAARLGTTIVFALQATKDLAGAPVPHIKMGGSDVDVPGFLTLAPGTQYVFTHVVTTTDASGSYSAVFDLVDLAGNAASVPLPARFTIDAVAPQPSPLRLTSNSVKAGATLGIGFSLNKVVAPSGVQVTLGTGAQASCTADATNLEWSCSYQVTGLEIPAGTTQAEVVLATVIDAAGNTGSSSSSVVFDFQPPAVGLASVSYIPDPLNPLQRPTEAATNTTIVVDLTASEALDQTIQPTLTASDGFDTIPFTTVTTTAGGATFQAVPGAVGDGQYEAMVRWSDVAGNLSVVPIGVPINIKTSPPSLRVDQTKVTWLRSPWGNAASEDLEPQTPGSCAKPSGSPQIPGTPPSPTDRACIPAGPYFALSPSDPLSAERHLSSDTFRLADDRRHYGDMAYDTNRGVLVRFGGLDDLSIDEDDIWEWSSQQWTGFIRPSPRPTGRHGQGMIYDPVRHSTMLFGGENSSSALDDLWEWDGTLRKWTGPLSPSTGPSGRSFFGMTWDSARNRIVLFGGRDWNYNNLDDLWEWDGATWYGPITPVVRPAARTGHSLVFDSVRQKTILFGGDSGNGYLNDVWEWDGATWTGPIQPAIAPAGRFRFGLTYDANRQLTVLFGGEDAQGVNYDDVWEWTGQSWNGPLTPAKRPTARHGPALAFDAALGHVLLFGGYQFTATDSYNVNKGDTWLWDGTTWTGPLVTSTTTPVQVRIWADMDRQSLLGTLTLGADGTWPRQALPLLDTTSVYVTGLDAAGNETLFPTLVENAEWVATPARFNILAISPADLDVASPHVVQMTSASNDTPDPTPSATTPWTGESGFSYSGHLYGPEAPDENGVVATGAGGIPAVQFTVSYTQLGSVASSSIIGLRVRSYCSAVNAPSGAGSTGTALFGWNTGGPGLAPSWTELSANSATEALQLTTASAPMPPPIATLLDWSAMSAAEAQQYLLGGPQTLSFRCLPIGVPVVGAPSVALDYIETRVRYSTRF